MAGESILTKIVTVKRGEVAARKALRSQAVLEEMIAGRPPVRDFRRALDADA